MPMSKAKQDKIARRKRVAEVNARSLNGKGYFMDANWRLYADRYVETGDPKYLALLPSPKF